MKLLYTILGLIIIVGSVLAVRAFGLKKGTEANEWPQEILKQTNDNRTAREAIKAKYPELFYKMRKCFFAHDPIGINFETNTDEYDPEVGTIIPRLSTCRSKSDVLVVVHEEFIKWFGEDTAGDMSSYEKIAEEVWKLWSEAQQSH
jgi:hypothetical protein